MSNKTAHMRYTASDVIRIALILERKVPGDIVPLILEFAELWTTVAAAVERRSCRITRNNAGLVVLKCDLPAGMPMGVVRRVRFATISRDQGWSSIHKDHGTYRGSWTWFEAGIKPQHAVEKFDMDLDSDTEMRLHPNRDGEGFAGPPSILQKTEYVSEDGYTLPPQKIITNVHAGNRWMTHIATWDVLDEDVKVRRAMRRLKGGDAIELSTFARYPGWVNNLKFASIEIEGLFVRKIELRVGWQKRPTEPLIGNSYNLV